MRKSLFSSEWALVGSLLLILGSLALIAKIASHQCSSVLATAAVPSHDLCLVRIEGAVKKPGVYPVLPGSLLKNVVAKSRPNRFADLKKIDQEFRVEGPLEVCLEELSEISVRIEGAVLSPVTLTLVPGAKVKDLRSKIAFSPDADLSLFKSRRMLKDGEILTVPKKRG